MNNKYNFALKAVLNETGINRSSARNVSVKLEDGLYYVCFHTDWQKYESYVDAETFEVLGLNFMPYTEEYSGALEYMVASTVA